MRVLLGGTLRNRKPAMSNFLREISFSLLLKFILLMVVWFVCVRGLQPHLLPPQTWFFGQESPISEEVKHVTDV